MSPALAKSIEETLTQGEYYPGFRRLDLIEPIDGLMGEDLQLVLSDGSLVAGWFTRRFLGGSRTYWTWVAGEMLPTCVDPVAWRVDRVRGDIA